MFKYAKDGKGRQLNYCHCRDENIKRPHQVYRKIDQKPHAVGRQIVGSMSRRIDDLHAIPKQYSEDDGADAESKEQKQRHGSSLVGRYFKYEIKIPRKKLNGYQYHNQNESSGVFFSFKQPPCLYQRCPVKT